MLCSNSTYKGFAGSTMPFLVVWRSSYVLSTFRLRSVYVPARMGVAHRQPELRRRTFECTIIIGSASASMWFHWLRSNVCVPLHGFHDHAISTAFQHMRSTASAPVCAFHMLSIFPPQFLNTYVQPHAFHNLLCAWYVYTSVLWMHSTTYDPLWLHAMHELYCMRSIAKSDACL